MQTIISVPSDKTAMIRGINILIGHIICGIVEEKLFGRLNPLK
ncbi:MAG: hypothetical protein WCS03_10380 [Bacteroidota bacterium]